MSSIDPQTTPGEEFLSLSDALEVVAEVLESLHGANIRLQNRMGPNLGSHSTDLIEDLQLLDRQAQITLDVVHSLRRLSEGARNEPEVKGISKNTLFRLDATRHELKSSGRPAGAKKPPPTEEIWL